MKIVFVNDFIYQYASGAPSAGGGAERQQWLLARALAAAGWHVTVGVRQWLKPGGRVVIDRVEFAGLSERQILWAWWRFLLSEKPDWLYWRCADHLLGPAVVLAKLAGARTIFAVALDRDVDVRHALFLRPQLWPLYYLGLAWTDRIFVQSRSQLMGLPERWRAKACVIPSIAAESPSIKPHAGRGSYVTWVAQLREVKRPDLLIQIARQLPAISFIVCGGSTHYMSSPGYGERVGAALRALPNVEYRDQVPPEEAARVIADAAALLSTSDEEGFPNTFLQAWGAGTPVVSLRIDPDHVIERYGLGVVSRGIDDAVASIRALIQAPELREKIAARARQYVIDHHNEAVAVRAFATAIARIPAGHFRSSHSLPQKI
jgi:glycosyltransferase involved in cell wall biosynthesis